MTSDACPAIKGRNDSVNLRVDESMPSVPFCACASPNPIMRGFCLSISLNASSGESNSWQLSSPHETGALASGGDSVDKGAVEVAAVAGGGACVVAGGGDCCAGGVGDAQAMEVAQRAKTAENN